MKKLFLVLIFCCYSINCYGLSIKNSGSVTFYVKCEPAKKQHIDIAKKAIDIFIKSYKKSTIRNNLREVRLCGKIILGENADWPTGTYDYDKKIIYLVANKKPHQRWMAEYILHHEFSSILLKSSHRWFNLKEVFLKNSKSDYGNVRTDDWMGYIKKFLNKGFVTPYSKTSFENDFNVIAGFYKTPSLQRKMSELLIYPLILKKYNIVKRFYKNL